MYIPQFEASVALLCAAVMLAGVLLTASWVYQDARAKSASGTPIVYTWGTLHISTPVGWFLACVVMFELFIPIYLDSRNIA